MSGPSMSVSHQDEAGFNLSRPLPVSQGTSGLHIYDLQRWPGRPRSMEDYTQSTLQLNNICDLGLHLTNKHYYLIL